MNSSETSWFPRSARIRKRDEFLRIQSTGRKVRSNSLLFIFTPSQTGESRLGITVTVKSCKRANARNRLKRRIRAIFRCNRHRFTSPVNLVVIARDGAAERTFSELQEEILSSLQRAGSLQRIGFVS